ncbi:MAG: hypothetical protein KDD11_08820 [Acidobacteria bacterium]|nr:hypothetical protein [Acidobacteriota bacterium]
MKRWGCPQFAVGCTGILLGAVVTIGVEVYLAIRATEKISEAVRESSQVESLQDQYDALCASGTSQKDRTLKGVCGQLQEKLEAAKSRDQRGKVQAAE